MYEVKIKKIAGVFFRSVNEIIRANDHVRLFILRMMMMLK